MLRVGTHWIGRSASIIFYLPRTSRHFNPQQSHAIDNDAESLETRHEYSACHKEGRLMWWNGQNLDKPVMGKDGKVWRP
jgi:hypothetical protein